jgi:hypothetical protein
VLDEKTPQAASIEPMMLLETDGRLVPVTAGAPSADNGEVPALVCPPDTPRDVVARHALSRATADLTAVERLIAVYKTARFVLDGALEAAVPIGPRSIDRVPGDLLEDYGALLGRPVSQEFVLRLLALLACAPDELELIHRLDLTVDHLIALLDTSVAERRAILRLHKSLPITVAETKRLSQWLLLLRGRKTFDTGEWLEGVARDPTAHASGTALIRSLRRVAHPTLTAREDELIALLKRLKLPAGMKLTYPEHLEGDSVSCYFDFSRVTDLERKLDAIKAAIDNGSIARMLDILNTTEKE